MPRRRLSAVSMIMTKTMSVRTASWDQPFGMHPIFEMNLPEGYLKEKLRLAFAKGTSRCGALDLLADVGRFQIGRLRYIAPDATLDGDAPFQSVDKPGDLPSTRHLKVYG
jgi:serine/threonine-protein kinase HipA